MRPKNYPLAKKSASTAIPNINLDAATVTLESYAQRSWQAQMANLIQDSDELLALLDLQGSQIAG